MSIRLKSALLFFIACTYLSGCSTIIAHVAITADEVSDNYDNESHSRTYCGARFNWETFQDTGLQGGNVMGFFMLPDLVVSTVADTVLLPLTWPYDLLKTNSDTNAQN